MCAAFIYIIYYRYLQIAYRLYSAQTTCKIMQKKLHDECGKIFTHAKQPFPQYQTERIWTCLEKPNEIKLYIILYNVHT